MSAISFRATLFGSSLIALVAASAPVGAQAVDAETVKQLLQTIEELQRRVETLEQQADTNQRSAEDAQQTATQAETKAEAAQAAVAQVPVDGDQPIVTSGNKKITLAVSGQVNRAMNFADDGRRTKYYNVDNDASNSRVRFVGTGEFSEDLTLGTKIEVAIAPNESSQVSQDNEESGNFFDQRYVEGWVDSKRFGKLSLGKGDSASNNTAEVDLSGTDVVQYASIADIAAGLQFRDTEGNLTGIEISDAFLNFDGLSRRDRVRYDTPKFYGFSLAGSAISNQRYDGAIFWAGQGYGLKAAAAAAAADTNVDDVDYRLDGSFSVLHENTGLNLTVSSGMDKTDGGNRSNFYVKGGWIANLFDLGTTNFGLDYTRSDNNPTPSEHGFSVGGAIVQNVTDFGAQLYSQVRLFDLSSNPNTDNIWIGTTGMRIKF